MAGLITSELVVILFIILLLFGGKKLPELAKSMGVAVKEFNKATSEPESYIKKETEKDKERSSILKAARALGIETEGRDIKEIAKDIAKYAEGQE